MAGRRLITAVITAAAALGPLTACEPPPPRLVLVVDSDGSGRDSAPGDGTCASAAAGGACTLPAAVDEGNASPTGADIELPPLLADPEVDPPVPNGEYSGFDLTVTGDVRLYGDSTSVGLVHVTVAPGGQLAVSGIRPAEYTSNPISFTVEGTLWLDRSVVEHNWLLSGASIRPVLEVTTTGSAVVTDSILASDHTKAAVVNAGVLVAVRSSIAPIQACPEVGCFGTDVAVHTAETGTTHLAGSAMHTIGPYWTHPARCTGRPITSHGHVHLEAPCGAATAGDTIGNAGVEYDFAAHELTLSATSPLVDAIPLDHPLCTGATVDVRGVTRGLDGDSDGIGGCDVGARER